MSARMDVGALGGRTVPPDPIVSGVRTSDGLRLRVVRWTSSPSRGTVVIATGRSEFVEHYLDAVRELLARRFDVVVFDWRGQGRSDREIKARRHGYVSNFSAYQRDLLALQAQILRMFTPRPWFAFGHSMGAAVLLEQAHRGRSPFDRLILSAPMIDLVLPHKRAVRGLVRTLDTLGFGRLLIPGGSEAPMFVRAYEGNILTSDPANFARLSGIAAQNPDLVVGSPTIRWLSSAFDLMERFEDPRYAVETLVPILIVAAGADRLIDNAAIERFAIRLKAGRCITLPHARHQILMERPEVLAQFWAAFDAFIPGKDTHDESAARSSDAEPQPPRSQIHRLARRASRWIGRRNTPQIRASRAGDA